MFYSFVGAQSPPHSPLTFLRGSSFSLLLSFHTGMTTWHSFPSSIGWADHKTYTEAYKQ